MKKTIKLKKNYEFNYVFKKGKYFCGDLIEVYYLKNNKKVNSIGIAVSSKICNAVNRNKIKRIIREAYYKLEDKIDTGNTFVFLWKKKVNIDICSYNGVLNDMKIILRKIGILINEENSNLHN